MLFVNAGWEMFRRWAAFPMLPSSMTASMLRRWRMSIASPFQIAESLKPTPALP